ncbi:HNH endonuclease [bacterium]|nr:MAG: HNH endonuclease [bacterium]
MDRLEGGEGVSMAVSTSSGTRCDCGRPKARSCFQRCTTCARAARRVERPLCACGCGAEVGRPGWTFASIACQRKAEYMAWVERWLVGEEDGVRGSVATSANIRRFLIETRGEKCQECGWASVNPSTRKIPIQIHHRDGDYANNRPDNLQLLCPNCHSLTDTHGGANRGNGRKARGAARTS